MSLTKEIITIEEYKEFQPDFSLLNIPEESLQAAINTTFLKLDAKCGGMISLVWDITDENDPNFRTELEHNFIKKAMALQTQTEVAYNNDPTGGQTSISGAGVSYSETRQRDQDTQIMSMVFDLLVKARVYFEQIAVETRLGTNNCDDFENLNPYDSKYEKDPITMSQADQRYIRQYQDPKLVGKVATIENNGLVVWKDNSAEADVSFADITGQPTDNTNLKNALDSKIDNRNGASKTIIAFGNNEANVFFESDVIKHLGLYANSPEYYISLEARSGSKAYYVKDTNKPTPNSEIAVIGDIVTLENKVDTNTTNIAKLETDKADKNDIINLLDDKQKQIIVAKGIETSEQYSKGDVIIDRDADFGNPALYIKTTPIRSGQIVLSNRYNGTDPAVSGNRFYANIYDNIPELNDQTKEVRFELNNTQAFPLIVNNNTDQNGYKINYDNIDTTLVISRGNSAAYAEGRITNQFTGSYVKNSQTYNWYNISLNCQVVNTAVGQDYIEFYGCGIGRDRNIFAILPNDKGPSDSPPESKPYNYFVYKKVV